MNDLPTFLLDGEEVPFTPGQTVLQAALTAGRYIPHLCYHPEFQPERASPGEEPCSMLEFKPVIQTSKSR